MISTGSSVMPEAELSSWRRTDTHTAAEGDCSGNGTQENFGDISHVAAHLDDPDYDTPVADTLGR